MSLQEREIERLLSFETFTKSDGINLMSQLRILLERENLRKEYACLATYCDWCLHSGISRSHCAHRMIESVADAIIESSHEPPSAEFFHDVTNGFQFEELRADLVNVSQRFGTPDHFCSDATNWSEFHKLLISILLERTLEFDESKAAAASLSRIQAKWTTRFKHSVGVATLSLVLGTGEYEGRVLWSAGLIPGPTCIPRSVTMRGPLMGLRADLHPEIGPDRTG